MSGPHATISAWERDEEDGAYTAEFHGWNLRVSWTPNDGEVRGYFSWAAEAGDKTIDDEERHEEMELAMAAAEQYAADQPADEEDDADEGDDD
jgi:hypothetical protein